MTARRTSKATAPETNVVALRAPAPETADTILAELDERGKAQKAHILGMLQDLNRQQDARREVDIQRLAAIARSLYGQDLADLIEVANRLAARRSRR